MSTMVEIVVELLHVASCCYKSTGAAEIAGCTGRCQCCGEGARWIAPTSCETLRN